MEKEKLSDKDTNEYYFLKEFVEAIKWRFMSPLYFYFTTSLIIINWDFFYTLLFVKQEFIYEHTGKFKIEYLSSMYDFSYFWIWSKITLLPFISAFLFIYVFHFISIKFYEKHKMNKIEEDNIDKKVSLKVREINYFKNLTKWWNNKFNTINQNKVNYNENEFYNSWIDLDGEKVEILEWSYNKSELLYYTEYDQYISWLESFKEDKSNKIKSFLESWSNQYTHKIVEDLYSYIGYFSEDEIKEILLWFTKNSQIIPDDDVKDFISAIYNKDSEYLNGTDIEKIEEFLKS